MGVGNMDCVAPDGVSLESYPIVWDSPKGMKNSDLQMFFRLHRGRGIEWVEKKKRRLCQNNNKHAFLFRDSRCFVRFGMRKSIQVIMP